MEADRYADNPESEQFGSIEEAQEWFKQQNEWVLSDG